MSTFYAVVPDPKRARLAVMALLNQGISADEISLVAKGDGAVFGHAPSAEETSHTPMSDASVFVGRGDDPVVDQMSAPEPKRSESQDFEMRESPVGPGISTATFNDAASSVDETDDPNWLAEDSIELSHGRTQEDHEVSDLHRAVETGFATRVQDQADIGDINTTMAVEDLERDLEVVTVPGWGVVLGRGALATAALDFADGDPTDDKAELFAHFQEKGITEEFANLYWNAIDEGRALLAVGIIPGEIDADLVEATAEEYGAEAAVTFDAPRF